VPFLLRKDSPVVFLFSSTAPPPGGPLSRDFWVVDTKPDPAPGFRFSRSIVIHDPSMYTTVVSVGPWMPPSCSQSLAAMSFVLSVKIRIEIFRSVVDAWFSTIISPSSRVTVGEFSGAPCGPTSLPRPPVSSSGNYVYQPTAISKHLCGCVQPTADILRQPSHVQKFVSPMAFGYPFYTPHPPATRSGFCVWSSSIWPHPFCAAAPRLVLRRSHTGGPAFVLWSGLEASSPTPCLLTSLKPPVFSPVLPPARALPSAWGASPE